MTNTCTHIHTHTRAHAHAHSQQSIPRSYTNEDISLDLRYSSDTVNARTCDINYLTVWCKSSEMHLSRIRIPASTFVRITMHSYYAFVHDICEHTHILLYVRYAGLSEISP